MVSECQVLVYAEDLNSRRPKKVLGSLTKWLATQVLDWVSAGFSTGEYDLYERCDIKHNWLGRSDIHLDLLACQIFIYFTLFPAMRCYLQSKDDQSFSLFVFATFTAF
jgi:hypothetical protein